MINILPLNFEVINLMIVNKNIFSIIIRVNNNDDDDNFLRFGFEPRPEKKETQSLEEYCN